LKNPNSDLFNYCPRCGKKSLRCHDEKSFLCGRCTFKFYLNTAAAGIALIFNTHDEILVTRRKYEPSKGMLDLPGGFADPGETLEACLIREIKEELDLEINSLRYFCSVPNTYIYKSVTYMITDFAFFCTVNDFKSIKACDDISDYYFLKPGELDTNLFGLASSKLIIEKLLKAT